MKREYHKWFSHELDRDMEMLVFGHGGEPVLFFPTRTARFYDYENWRIVEALADKTAAGELQLFCVDSVDIESFYSPVFPPERIKRHQQYEQYILNEVLPFIKKINNHRSLTAAGCSLGGYHAVNIAFRHPQLFTKVVGMSARYDLTLSTPAFANLFDGYFDENIYFNMPGMFIPNLNDEDILDNLKKMDIVIVIGREDPFFENNCQLITALTAKNISPSFYIWDEEAHRARYWRQMVRLYL